MCANSQPSRQQQSNRIEMNWKYQCQLISFIALLSVLVSGDFVFVTKKLIRIDICAIRT